MSLNTSPKEDKRFLTERSVSAKSAIASSRWLAPTSVLHRPQSCESFYSCLGGTPVFGKSKSSRAEIINSALSSLTNEGVSLNEILHAIDPSLRQNNKDQDVEVDRSPVYVLKDESPIIPRRCSEPCVMRMTRTEFPRRSTQTDGVLRQDFRTAGAMNSLPVAPPLTQGSVVQSPPFAGMLLQCPDPDDSVDSDLTKTDPDDDSSQEKSKVVPTVARIPVEDTSPQSTSSKMSSTKSPRRRRRGRRKQNNDTQLQDTPMSPSQFNRRSMPTNDTSKIELSGSPSAARVLIPVGISGRRKGRGRSPREYRSARAERRWSEESSRPRPNSLDRTPSTPRRSNRTGNDGEKRWSLSSHKKNANSVDLILETPKRKTKGKKGLTSPASDQKSPPSEVREKEKKKSFQHKKSPNKTIASPSKKEPEGSFYSPLETTPGGTDKRTPTSHSYTPPRASDDERDNFQTLECPPPL
jgi:hypothetical protein